MAVARASRPWVQKTTIELRQPAALKEGAEVGVKLRPGMPLDLSVNQGGLYHLLVAPPFETSLVLVLVIDGSKGLFGTARIRLTQIASDLQMIEDSSDHLIPIKLE